MQEVIASSSTSSVKTSSSQNSDIEDVTKEVKAEHLTSTSSSSTSSLSSEEEDATKEIDTEENSTNGKLVSVLRFQLHGWPWSSATQ